MSLSVCECVCVHFLRRQSNVAIMENKGRLPMIHYHNRWRIKNKKHQNMETSKNISSVEKLFVDSSASVVFLMLPLKWLQRIGPSCRVRDSFTCAQTWPPYQWCSSNKALGKSRLQLIWKNCIEKCHNYYRRPFLKGTFHQRRKQATVADIFWLKGTCTYTDEYALMNARTNACTQHMQVKSMDRVMTDSHLQ